MQDLNDLYYFSQIARHGGFAAAGRALNLPKSKLSRRLAGLEARLNTRLIHRSNRQFSLTSTGQAYLKHCEAMLVEAQAAQDMIDQLSAEPQGRVRISCPISLLETVASPILSDFMHAYPKVTLEVDATNRRVDPVDESIDLALRVRGEPLDDSDLHLRILSRHQLHIVASPQLFERYPRPKTPEDLQRLPSVGMTAQRLPHEWRLKRDDFMQNIPYQPRLETDNMIALRKAVVDGHGIAELPSLMIHNELESGQLVPLLPDWHCSVAVVHLVYASRRGQLPAVRALIDYLAERFQAQNGLTQHA